jgi:hypothetical protein
MDNSMDSWAVETGIAIRPNAIAIRPDAAVAIATDAIAVATDAVAASPSRLLIGKFFACTRVKRRFHRFHWSRCVSQLCIFGASACWLGHVMLLLVEAVIHVRYGLRWTGVMDNGMDSWAVETGVAIRPDAAVAGRDNAAGVAIAVRPVATIAATAIDAAVAIATAAVSWDESRLFIPNFLANLKREGGSAQKHRTYKAATHQRCHR